MGASNKIGSWSDFYYKYTFPKYSYYAISTFTISVVHVFGSVNVNSCTKISLQYQQFPHWSQQTPPTPPSTTIKKTAIHHSDVIMGAIAVYWVCSGADQRKHQSSASLAFVRGIHRLPVNSPHNGPVMRKCFHLMTSSWTITRTQ